MQNNDQKEFQRPFYRSQRTVYTTDDLENGLPGAPAVLDFYLPPIRKKPIPQELRIKEPALRTTILFSLLLVLVSFWDWSDPMHTFALSNHQLFSQNRWEILPLSVLSHGDGAHLASNLISFAGFTYLLKRHFGWIAGTVLPFLAGLLTAALTLLTMPPHTGLIGASGIVFAMVGLYVTLYILLENRYTVPQRLARGFGFLLVLFVPQEYSPTTSYQAHGIGFLIGVFMALIVMPYFLGKKSDERPVRVERPERVQQFHVGS